MHPLEIARRRSYAPRDRRGLREWAAGKHLPAAYSFKGAFDLGLSPWLFRQWEALDDPLVREVTCIAAVRTGKTLGADLFFAKQIATDSAPMMFNIGNDEDAKEHAQVRFIPLLRSIPEVRAKLTGNPHDVKASLIKFVDGSYIVIQGIKNPNNFDSKGICYLVNDEGHKAPAGNLAKAKSRTDDYRLKCKILNISQGGVVGDDMEVAFKRGTMEAFGWRCPKCDLLQEFLWRNADGSFNVRWEKNEETCPDGRWNLDAMAETIKFHCANTECDHFFQDTEHDRRVMTYECGEYLPPANPIAPRSVVSVTWNQLCIPWIPWREIAVDWIEAMAAFEIGDSTKLKEFIQRRLAQNWEDGEIFSVGESEVRESDYMLGESWEDEDQRFMACDAQAKGGEHYVCVIRAFAKDGRSRLVWAGRLESFSEIRAKADEYQILGARVGIDSAHDTHNIEAACAKYNWRSMRGDDGLSWSHRGDDGITYQKPFDPGKRIWVGFGVRLARERMSCWRFHWSRPVFSDILQRRLSGKSLYYGVPGDISNVARYRDPNYPAEERYTDYWPQMRSWHKIKKLNKTTGVEKPIWARIGKRHDHYRSAELMALAMAGIGKCLGGEASSVGEEE